MHTIDTSELNKFVNLATLLEVTPPQTKDILKWWKAILSELKISDVQLLSVTFFYAVKQFEMSERFIKMSEMLEQRKIEMGL